LMRGRLLAGFVAVAVLVPSVVLATHTWPDVPDGRFYTVAVEWAQANGMTTGCDGGTNFCPDRGVSRAENLTYAKRYDDLVVQPALAAIRQSPDRVVWVADDGTGDFLLLSAALDSINDASASNPYVVRIAPGEYTETSPVALKTYVDVEGSGQGITTITCACAGADYDASSATVSAGDIAAEIRHLTINNTGGDSVSIGVHTEDVVDGTVSMSDVTATGTGGTSYNYGVYNWSSSPSMMNVTATGTGGTYSYGVYNRSLSSSSPVMTNVTATGTGGTYSYGVHNNVSSPSMMNVTATATGGTNNYGVYNYSSSSPSVRSSSFTGDDYSIYNGGASSAQVADTMLDGTVTAGGGLTCVGAYDETFSALNASCS
ncbi:MAG: hypothetical protein P8L46_08645, partial [Acidimicrobiales bacterium]|nr:hypothetical protein [Acidimicrobiales bacterium]